MSMPEAWNQTGGGAAARRQASTSVAPGAGLHAARQQALHVRLVQATGGDGGAGQVHQRGGAVYHGGQALEFGLVTVVGCGRRPAHGLHARGRSAAAREHDALVAFGRGREQGSADHAAGAGDDDAWSSHSFYIAPMSP